MKEETKKRSVISAAKDIRMILLVAMCEMLKVFASQLDI